MTTQETEGLVERLTKLAREYRPSIPPEVAVLVLADCAKAMLEAATALQTSETEASRWKEEVGRLRAEMSSSNASPAATGPIARIAPEAEPSAAHALDCQSHIVDVRGRPDDCTCGAEPAPVAHILIEPDDLQEHIRQAYLAGCCDVQENYRPLREGEDPEFGEASYDYVASLDFTETTKPYRGPR